MYSRKWPYVVAIVLLVFVVMSLRPVHRLRPNAPQSFLQATVAGDISADRWGGAYWQVARNICWKFPYGEALPEDPPAEFRISEEHSVSPSAAAHLRTVYWNQLRTAWSSPEAWSTTYELNFHWIPEVIERFLTWTVDTFHEVRGRMR
jgi:hypothetical protein